MEPSKHDCAKGQCDKLMQERMHYFMGRHLTARDFTDEQAYHRTHRLFHNRLLHGWGVVCGLDVREHTREDCRTKYVEVTPGVAIDCCGREIVVQCIASCSEQRLPEIPWKDYSETHPLLLLCLVYEEKGMDPVPVLNTEGDCSETKTKYGRYQEGWKLCWRWIADPDLKKYQWKNQYDICPPEEHREGEHGSTGQPNQQQQSQSQNVARQREELREHRYSDNPFIYPGPPCPEDDCGDPCGEDYKSCIEPQCPPHHCVPLAVICAKPGEPVTTEEILTKGRPELPFSPRRLTHIIEINWPHGGVITPRWFYRHRSFRVTFDRRLKPAPYRPFPGPWGVNEATFVVQFGEQYEDLDFVTYEEPPRLSHDEYQAVYRVSPRKHHHDEYRYLIGHIVWITLKCDFLYDCHGVRVDGNNDGVAGGTFESWVSVVSDYDYDQMNKDGKL